MNTVIDTSSCLSPLKERRFTLDKNLFDKIILDSSHKLHKFLPEKNVNVYNLRRQRRFQVQIKGYNQPFQT